MTSTLDVPRLANIRLHPIKSLDPVSVSQAAIGPAGGLALDRAWALYSADGRWVNGKRTPAIHLIRATYSPDLQQVTLAVPNDSRNLPVCTFAFPSDYEGAAEWFSLYFEQQIIVRYSADGFPDDTVAHGPTIASTASLQAVCDWFNTASAVSGSAAPYISLEEARLRFRATLEIDGVPAFWEDRLFAPEERAAVRFSIGEVHFEGSNPCARCPVPPRNPLTGENLPYFQKLFTERRAATLPPWSPRERFDHFYRFSTNTRVASTQLGRLLRTGDPLTLAETHGHPSAPRT